MPNIYELYSDERENHRTHELILGGLICTDIGAKRMSARLEQVRNDYRLGHEFHWRKGIPRHYLPAFKAWVDVFVKDPYARLVLFRINRSSADWRVFKKNEKGRLTSAYHQFLLVCFGKLSDTRRWVVYPDSGLPAGNNSFRRIEFLLNKTYKNAFGQKSSRIIRCMSPTDSKQMDLLQLLDILMGALDFESGEGGNAVKLELKKYCDLALIGKKTRKGLNKLSECNWMTPTRFVGHRKRKDES